MSRFLPLVVLLASSALVAKEPAMLPKGYLDPEARDHGIKVSDIDAIDCDRDMLAALIRRIETNPENRIDSLLIATGHSSRLPQDSEPSTTMKVLT